jgi:hypothetical protein
MSGCRAAAHPAAHNKNVDAIVPCPTCPTAVLPPGGPLTHACCAAGQHDGQRGARHSACPERGQGTCVFVSLEGRLPWSRAHPTTTVTLTHQTCTSVGAAAAARERHSGRSNWGLDGSHQWCMLVFDPVACTQSKMLCHTGATVASDSRGGACEHSCTACSSPCLLSGIVPGGQRG